MKQHTLVCAAFVIGAIAALYYAMQNDDENGAHYVPEVQTEAQFAGLSAGGKVSVQTDTGPLDLNPAIHFWAPGFGFGLTDQQIQPVSLPHRYPAVSGANITAVMHHGWSALSEPTCNEWFRNPPEAAVL